jgi:hypothetical protein
MYDLTAEMQSAIAPLVHEVPDVALVRARAAHRRRQRRVRVVVVGALVLALALASAAMLRVETRSSESRIPPADQVPTTTPQQQVEYPPDIVAQARQMADGLWPEDPLRFSEDRSGTIDPPLLASKEDMTRMVMAERARIEHLPYNERDLLVPLRKASGQVVGYMATGISSVLTPEQVASPDFNLCALQTQALADTDATLRELQASDPAYATFPLPSGTASERLGCTP